MDLADLQAQVRINSSTVHLEVLVTTTAQMSLRHLPANTHLHLPTPSTWCEAGSASGREPTVSLQQFVPCSSGYANYSPSRRPVLTDHNVGFLFDVRPA